MCKVFGGQCVCLPGVRGRQCDECRPGTYDLSPSGCTSNNRSVYSAMKRIKTLFKPCITGTLAHMCAICTDVYKSMHAHRHTHRHMHAHIHTRMFLCPACSCDPVGSVSELCDPELGRCDCLPNVAGPNCSTCEPNFWGLTDDRGCTPCSCNEIGTQGNVSNKVYIYTNARIFLGSSSLQCDEVTGECQCKPGVTGSQCDSCDDSYYGFSTDGCRLD